MKSVSSYGKLSKGISHFRSNSPTLASSRSQKGSWRRQYMDEPIPNKLRTRLIGRKIGIEQFDDEELESKEINPVVEEEEEMVEIKAKRKRLPRFKIISDNCEFTSQREKIHSERKINQSPQRCRSVQSLKLPQVLEEKKEEDELNKLRRHHKLSYFKDKNEFNRGKNSDSYSEVISKVESLEVSGQFKTTLPEQIEQNEAEQTKSQKLPNQKSIITAEIQKIIVDELDDKRKRTEEYGEQNINIIIEEEKLEEEDQVNTDKLRLSLSKFESESEYLTKDEELPGKSSESSKTPNEMHNIINNEEDEGSAWRPEISPEVTNEQKKKLENVEEVEEEEFIEEWKDY